MALIDKSRKSFVDYMDDDFNTAGAIGVIFDYVRDINGIFADGGNCDDAKLALAFLEEMLDVLGLFKKTDDIPSEITELAEKRIEARKNKNYALADELRDEILSKGYVIKDTSDGYKISKSN